MNNEITAKSLQMKIIRTNFTANIFCRYFSLKYLHKLRSAVDAELKSPGNYAKIHYGCFAFRWQLWLWRTFDLSQSQVYSRRWAACGLALSAVKRTVAEVVIKGTCIWAVAGKNFAAQLILVERFMAQIHVLVNSKYWDFLIFGLCTTSCNFFPFLSINLLSAKKLNFKLITTWHSIAQWFVTHNFWK